MKRQIIQITFFLLMGISSLQAQQDPMFTKYMFNPLNYNPAYAGSAGALDMVLLHRQQWWGIKGAPMTQSLSIHSPIKDKNIGLGLNLSLDQIATQRNLNAYGTFAYRIPLNRKGTTNFAIGMQGGVSNVAADWRQLDIENPNDPAFQDLQPNLWLPNFGAGVYVHSEKWFVGLSSPMLINNDLRQSDNRTIPTAQQYRHYYLTGGAAFNLTPSLVFRPSILVKNVGLFMERNQLNKVGAPTEFDIDAAFLFNKIFWIGASFRSAFEAISNDSSNDSVDFWASIRLKNGLRIGVAYDYTLTEIQGPAQGTYEILLGYDLIRYVDKIRHVRYF